MASVTSPPSWPPRRRGGRGGVAAAARLLRRGPPRLFVSLGCLVAIGAPAAAAEGSELIPGPKPLPTPLELQPLSQHLGDFQLTGEKAAKMADINGGKMCTGPFGKEPPAYKLTGALTLRQCADITKAQPNSIGFRWGRSGFEHKAFFDAVHSGDSNPQLSKLFANPVEFSCFVYVKTGEDEEETEFQVDVSAFEIEPELEENDGWHWQEICFQRWSLLKFVQPQIYELWFCYMPHDMVDECLSAREEFKKEGIFFLIVVGVFLAVLGYIMGGNQEFEIPLLWFSRFMVCIECAIMTTERLIRTPEGVEVNVAVFGVLVVIVVFIVSQLIILPARLAKMLGLPTLNVFWLMILAFSPAVFFEAVASYYTLFPMIVERMPVLLGLIAFGFDVVAHYTKRALCGGGSPRSISGDGFSPRYEPMGQTTETKVHP